MSHGRTALPNSESITGPPANNYESRQTIHHPSTPSTATMAAEHTETHYHPHDAIGAAMKATTLTGGVGLFAAAVQNTLTKQNVGPLGIFFKSGGTIGIFGMDTDPVEGV